MSMHPELAWIAEARKHLGLTEIKGSEHNKTIIAWLERLKAWWRDDETPWCLTGDIEVLTDQGFIRLDHISQVQPNQVAQLNPDTLEVEFTAQYGYIEKDYSGKVFDVNAGGLNFTCDPKHKLFGAFSGTRKYKLREIETLTKFGIEIPQIQSSQVGVPCTDADLVFMAAFLSDGCIRSNRVNFKFSKEHKIALIEQYPYERKTVDTKLHGVSKKPYTQYSFDKSLLKSGYLAEYKLLTWEFVKSLSQHQAKVFIDAYSNFDGTQSQGGGFEVFTTDKKLQEQLNYIATMAGYKSTPFSVKQVNTQSKIEYLHHVYVSKNKHRCFNKSHLTERDYSGKLYCLTVPSSVMIMRCRNGVIIPIGNCGVFIAHCLASAGMQRGKVNSRSKNWTGDKAPPNHYPYNWYGAIEYMKEGGTKLNKPCYGCVAVKTRKGGGHVAFVVGQTHSGMLVCLGGNQNNKVSYALYRPTDFDAFMWYGTTSSPASHRYDLPVLRGITETSVSEA